MELSVSKTILCIKKFVHEQKNKREKGKPCYLKEDCLNLLEKILEINKFEFAKKIIETYPGFLSDPASKMYHGNYQGGLFEHSIGVYAAALEISRVSGIGVNSENVDAIACIFHDLCKVGKYKNKEKTIDRVNTSFYEYDPDYEGIEHGAESLRRLLTVETIKDVEEVLPKSWQYAIAYHMGVFGVSNEELRNFSSMSEKYPEILLLHHADMVATKIYKI